MTMKKEVLLEVFQEKTPTLLVTIDGYDIYNDNTLVSPIELEAIAIMEAELTQELEDFQKEAVNLAGRIYLEGTAPIVIEYAERLEQVSKEIAYLVGVLNNYAEWYQWCEVREDDGTFWPNEKINAWLYYNRFNLV